MVLPESSYLPSQEELKVKEITLSSPVLRASAIYLGKYCDEQSKEFMLCKRELKDPRLCLKEGKAVTACGIEFFDKIKKTCKQELDSLAKCSEWNSSDLSLRFCPDQEIMFDACMVKKFGMNRPPLGYFSQLRIHDSKRPKAPEYVPNFPEPSAKFPEGEIPINEGLQGTAFIL